MNFLSFGRGKYGHLYVPTDINCTATNAPSSKAFVIQDLFLLDEVLDSNMLNKYYQAIRKKGLQDICEGGKQRSTHYIRSRGINFELADVLEKSTRRKFCFVGKLVAPYILPLNSTE